MHLVTDRSKRLFNTTTTRCLLLLFLWGSLWGVFGDEALPPNGQLFYLLVLFVAAIVAGEISKACKLPALLGMLFAGFAITNVAGITFSASYSAPLRSFALTIILLRAGLGLDPEALRKLSAVCLKLAFIPCLVETASTAVTGHFLLGLPLKWGALLGFVLAAVSPAVVVPGMISLQEKLLGTDKGIPTLVIAAASVDDVLAITGFGVALGFVFTSDSSLFMQVAKGPLEAVAGFLLGASIGMLLRYFPNRTSHTARLAMLVFSGCFAIFASNRLDFSGAGPLAALTSSYVAGIQWRKEETLEATEGSLKIVWQLCQPFLFGLIGAEVIIASLDKSAMLYAICALMIGLVFRCAAAFLAVAGAGLSFKERIFVCLAWLPKATVQAAVGPVALDMARRLNDSSAIAYSTMVLNVAVISILITAPLGAVAIALGGPVLLTQGTRTVLDDVSREEGKAIEEVSNA